MTLTRGEPEPFASYLAGRDPRPYEVAIDRCPQCRQEMAFFAALWDLVFPETVTGNRYVCVVFSRCGVCEVLSARHFVD